MHYAVTMRSLLLIIGLSWTLMPQAGTVYRYLDEDGSVVFTDTPREGAEVVEVKEITTITLPTVPGSVPAPAAAQDDSGYYTVIEISSPGNDLAIRENSGDIHVSVSVLPRLRPTDTVTLYLDGAEVQSAASTSFELHNVERGTHQLRAVVKGPDNKILASSGSVTFHMLRYSALQQQGGRQPTVQSTSD